MVKYCDNCGQKIDNDKSSFCNNCGHPLNNDKNEAGFIEKHKLPVIGTLVIIIIILLAGVLVTGGFLNSDSSDVAPVKNETSINESVELPEEENEKTAVVENEEEKTSQVSEPDYESYTPVVSFEDTDTDGDGYVYLSDMNIAHTPQDVQYQMYADSDDDGDGKLNYHEYHKFMYKLNYDYESYGVER